MIKENYVANYTPAEEKANALSHGFGAFLSLIALGFLTYYSLQTNSLLYIITSIVFGVSLVILYTASTVYHSCKGHSTKELGTFMSSKKRFFRVIDHSSIYILISGSYTPFLLISLHNKTGYILCAILWISSLIGITLKFFFVNSFKIISTLIYLGMGWSVVFVVKTIYLSVPFNSFALIALGGFFYTSGLIFYLRKKIPYNHTIWHFFVMAGSICHFFSLLIILQNFRG